MTAVARHLCSITWIPTLKVLFLAKGALMTDLFSPSYTLISLFSIFITYPLSNNWPRLKRLFLIPGTNNTSDMKECFPSHLLINPLPRPAVGRVLSSANFTLLWIVKAHKPFLLASHMSGASCIKVPKIISFIIISGHLGFITP